MTKKTALKRFIYDENEILDEWDCVTTKCHRCYFRKLAENKSLRGYCWAHVYLVKKYTNQNINTAPFLTYSILNFAIQDLEEILKAELLAKKLTQKSRKKFYIFRLTFL